MKRQILSSVLLLSVAVAWTAHAMPNPSAIYCVELGYQYETWTDPDGSQYGVCIFPDGSHCNAWDFFNKCYLGKSECDCHWPCTELPCKQAGQTIIVGECCPGLTQIPNAMTFDEHCNPIGIGGAAPVCSDCGNGICENWESTCNCPLDCGFLKTIYVDDDATGANNGTSWENAFNSLQDALKHLRYLWNPKPAVYVAEGTYRPYEKPGDFQGSYRNGASFWIYWYTRMYGGFPAGGCAWEDRDPNKHETILSGDLEQDDRPISDLESLENRGNTWNDNCEHVLRIDFSTEDSVLDGFTITGGNATCCFQAHRNDIEPIQYSGRPGCHDEFCRGGGIWGFGTGKAVITNCRIVSNIARDGAGIAGCMATIRNCTIHNNVSSDEGGGLAFCNGLIESCLIQGNVANNTGAIFRCDGTFFRCIMSGNESDYGPPAIGFCGGLISHCIISGNTGLMGAALDNCTGPVTNCVVAGNIDTEGIEDCSGPISNCIVWGNNFVGNEYKNQIYSSSIPTFSCVQGGCSGEGCIDSDPLFMNPGYWDPNNTPDDTEDDFWVVGDDYHLKSQAGRWDPDSNTWVQDNITSACIDAGNPMSPIGPEPFPNGGIINMGAYGATVEASKSYFGGPVCETIVAGDINGDCVVDFRDMAIMMSHWLQPGQLAPVVNPSRRTQKPDL